MKNLLVFILIIAAFGTIFGQGIQFESEASPWTTILQKAKQENKIIFMVVYSNSCHNCQYMQEEVYKQEEVGCTFNDQYINVKIDADQGQGIDLAAQYQVLAYPTYLYLNAKGELLHKALGRMTAEKFVQIGEEASDPNAQYFSLKGRFYHGDRSVDMLRRLTLMAIELTDAPLLETVHLAYLDTQKDWLTPENMEIVLAGAKTIEQPTFSFFLQHKSLFAEKFGKAKIYNKIDQIVLNSISLHAYDQVKRDFDLKKAKAYGARYLPSSILEQAIDLFAINEFLRHDKTANFLSATVKYFDRYPCYNGFLLNNLALAFYEKTEEEALLRKALKWSLQAIQLEDSYRFNDTAAALYFKLGNKSKAKELAQKAIQKAAEFGDEAQETKSLLQKIELM